MTPLIQQARERAPYYREWAKDIRGNNGTSVDADHADGTADLLDRLATALSSAEEEKQRAVSEEREACAVEGAAACDCDACARLVTAAIRGRATHKQKEPGNG